MGPVRVEVVYALPEGADSVALQVSAGTTLAGAVAACGLLERHPELAAGALRLGVYGEEKDPATPAKPGDRIEVYRPLAMDPKEARRQRARRASRKVAG